MNWENKTSPLHSVDYVLADTRFPVNNRDRDYRDYKNSVSKYKESSLTHCPLPSQAYLSRGSDLAFRAGLKARAKTNQNMVQSDDEPKRKRRIFLTLSQDKELREKRYKRILKPMNGFQEQLFYDEKESDNEEADRIIHRNSIPQENDPVPKVRLVSAFPKQNLGQQIENKQQGLTKQQELEMAHALSEYYETMRQSKKQP